MREGEQRMKVRWTGAKGMTRLNKSWRIIRLWGKNIETTTVQVQGKTPMKGRERKTDCTVQLNMRTLVWLTDQYHGNVVTPLSPFSQKRQLLPFLCQQGWLMEVESSASHHSKREKVAGSEGTPIYTFHKCIGEPSKLWSEWPPIEADKKTQSVWMSWRLPRWWRNWDAARGPKKNTHHHLATACLLRVRSIPSNRLVQLGERLAVPRCGCSGEDRLPLAFVVSICFPSHLLLVSHLPMFVWCRRELGSSASVPADSLSV